MAHVLLRPLRRLGLARLVALVLMVSAAACSKSTTAPSNEAEGSVVGTWELVSVNGRSLPAEAADGLTYREYTKTLRADSTYTAQKRGRFVEEAEDVDEAFEGDWGLIGGRLILDGAEETPLLIEGNRLTQTIDEDTFVWRKR